VRRIPFGAATLLHNLGVMHLGEWEVQAHRIVNTVKITSWAELESLSSLLPGWVYRGQRLASWRLSSALERSAPASVLTGLAEIELQSLARFQESGVGRALKSRPLDDDAMSWFALMQHYGQPTRLVDFTDDIWVAAYFALALDREVVTSDTAAVWAVNTLILRRMSQDQLVLPDSQRVELESDLTGGGLFNFLFGRTRVHGVGAVGARAASTNLRMQRQKGLFVYALNVERTFEENIFGVYDLLAADAHRHVSFGFWDGIQAPHIQTQLQSSPVVKILIPPDSQASIRAAVEERGINRELLFPDEALSGA
jgi:hypothetical protein